MPLSYVSDCRTLKASIELSADGPIRPPYTAYVQGGLTYAHVKNAICSAVDALLEQGFIDIPAR
ncbi:methionine gamma-lyase family protein [Bacillus pumilus]|uniref:methionine gamma-lyase family protein n=1 Tax=Bacillus pumilus TaxID=1408 RepID=UPI003F69CF10